MDNKLKGIDKLNFISSKIDSNGIMILNLQVNYIRVSFKRLNLYL